MGSQLAVGVPVSRAVFLPKGTIVSMRYHYDNSAANPHNPSSPPRRVRGGNQSTDEMAHLWLQLLPRGPGDQRAILQEAIMNRRLEKYPADFSAHFNLGALASGAKILLRPSRTCVPPCG